MNITVSSYIRRNKNKFNLCIPWVIYHKYEPIKYVGTL